MNLLSLHDLTARHGQQTPPNPPGTSPPTPTPTMELANHNAAEGIGPSRPTPTLELASAVPNTTSQCQLQRCSWHWRWHQWTNSNGGVGIGADPSRPTPTLRLEFHFPIADDQPGATMPDRTVGEVYLGATVRGVPT
jgi:hypothetical protein